MPDKFPCPECGKTFTRAASLGAHRQRAHGVAGTSNSAKVKTSARKSASTRGKSVRKTDPATMYRHDRRRATTNEHVAVNRDSLLRALFPNGVPPRENVIRDVGQWLDMAERLAKAG